MDAKKPSAAIKEFLNPHSMLTPGACGAITMLITNTLASQFGAPPNYTGLIISCLFGLIVFAATATVLWLRLVFWVLNSLIIFSIGLGTNQAGLRASKNTQPGIVAAVLSRPSGAAFSVWQPKTAFFANWLDGTVPRRHELLSRVETIDESTAEKTLKQLGIEYENPKFAKAILEKSAASAQTSERVTTLERAVLKAQSGEEHQ